MIATSLGLFFVASGIAFGLIAAIGILRFPDLYSRMHAATKAGAFGLALVLVGINLFDLSPRVFITSILILLMFYFTTPLAGHMIGRAAFRSGISRSPRTKPVDRLEQVKGDSPNDPV